MKPIKAIEIETEDLDNTNRPFLKRLKPEVLDAVCDAEVVLHRGEVIKNRHGHVTAVRQ